MDIVIINSFDEYIQRTEELKGKYYFRGQSNSAWDIIPSLFRNSETLSLINERNTIREKMSESPKQSPIEALFHLQHYGKATRFCDVTVSQLSALFFASEGETDGAVFVIRKDTAVNLRSCEMDIFGQALVCNNEKLSDIEIDSRLSFDIGEVLSQNYVVDYKGLGYSNPRAFRQGGTGILFGFSIEGNSISSIGSLNIDDLLVQKIIITKEAKTKILSELRQLGYSKEMLYDNFDEAYHFDNVNISQTSFTIRQRYDKSWFYKICAEYQINTLYYNRDDLALQISVLYTSFFRLYGDNSRVWTFFYFDENDFASKNWICRGCWDAVNQYEIRWNKGYMAYRLNHFNEQIASKDAIDQMVRLVNEINPIYNRIIEYTSHSNYDIHGFFELINDVQAVVRKISENAGSIPYTDLKNQFLPDIAWRYINNIDWLVGDMLIFSNRTDMKDQTIRWMLSNTYLSACEKSKMEYETFLNKKDEKQNNTIYT